MRLNRERQAGRGRQNQRVVAREYSSQGFAPAGAGLQRCEHVEAREGEAVLDLVDNVVFQAGALGGIAQEAAQRCGVEPGAQAWAGFTACRSSGAVFPAATW